MFSKTDISFFIITWLFYQATAFAQAPPPDLNCASIQTNNDVILEWINNNACFPLILWSSNNKNGPYQALDTIYTAGTTNYTHSGAGSSNWYYYMNSDPNCPGGISGYSDTISNSDPVQPSILSVSVLNGTDVEIKWTVSPSSETFAYLIYWDQNADNTYSNVDTVWGRFNTNYIHTSFPDTRIESYTVASMDSCKNTGPYNNKPHSTILLNDSVDRCGPSVIINWNSYDDWLDGVKHYDIYLSINGGTESLIGQNNFDNLNFTQNGLNDGDQVCFRVEGVSNSGETSSSNTTCIDLDIVQPPQYAYINKISVVNNEEMEIEFYVDPNADLKYLHLYKKESESDFSKVAKIPNPGNLNQVFNFTDIDINPEVYYYQYELRPQDSCNNMHTSELAKSILLGGKANYNYTNSLNWNAYGGWLGEVDYYELYRKDAQDNWLLITTLGNTDITYNDDIASVESEDGIFCYKIVAYEGSNSQNQNFGISSTMESHSNSFCVTQWPPIHMPNAFVPDGNNSVFKPISRFIDKSNFKMTIFDRWGKALITTTDPGMGWDGVADGVKMPQGVYLYFIEFTNPDGEIYKKDGTFVLVR